jgi:enoyl-CoA hydratase
MQLSYNRSENVSESLSDGVLRVTVERPEKRNPLSLGVLERIREIFTATAEREDIRLAILTGAGDAAFASGGDLVELASLKSVEAARALSLHGKAALNAVRRFPVPVVARVNGLALGGGAELALACDMRFAAAHATIGLIHARLAISPSWGGSADLMRLVGTGVATRMLARAEILDAQAAHAIGLFDGVESGGGGFEAAVEAFVRPMTGRPPQVMRAIKAASLAARMHDIEGQHAVETDNFGITWPHEDHWAAVAAIRADRPRS